MPARGKCMLEAVSANETRLLKIILTQCIIAPDEFTTARQNLHATVANNSKIIMFWCPNVDRVENTLHWWPGAEYVDMVGVDNYPPAGTTFAYAYGDFYDGLAARYNKYFCVGEWWDCGGKRRLDFPTC